MKDYLTVGSGITLILVYIVVNLCFMYMQHKSHEKRREDINRGVQALAKSVETQQVTIEKLVQIVAKTTALTERNR